MTPSKTRASIMFWCASLLFFLSGGTGLAYQVVWFKKFNHVWGSSSLAMAAVVASFLTGLGLGAHLIGRITDRVKGPLFWYGVAEILIGIIALIIPLEIQVLQYIAAALYSSLLESQVLHTIVRYFFTFIVLAPPCILMGGTLPLLCKHFLRPGGAPRESTGWLYAINTLGAALGCYLAGFHIAPSIGLFWMNVAVAILNLAIGGAAIALYKASSVAPVAGEEPAPEEAEAVPAMDAPEPADEGAFPSLLPLYIASAITGSAALILEMVWSRQLSLILGGSTYAFTAMLTTVLVGIGLGSLAFHVGFRKGPNAGRIAAVVIIFLTGTAVLGKIFLPEVHIVVALLKDLRGSQAWNAAICMWASACLQFLPAFGMGLLFPLFVDLTRKREKDAGEAVGNIYAWNTVGSILGATITSLVFVPSLGTVGTIILALILYGIGLVLLLGFYPLPRTVGDAVVAFVIVQVMMVIVYMGFGRPDARITDIGLYMYGYDGHEQHRYKNEFFEEGRSANVLVTSQNNHFSIRVNGKVDASTSGDMNNQLGHAYFPRFMFPDAKRVCVIGFGSGTTSGTSLLFPGTKVVCCEIEENVYKASRFFHGVNHAPDRRVRDGSFKPIFDDGRSYLSGTEEKFDLILSAPSNPWIAGIASLYTQEWYDIVKTRLSEGGILAQWIQMYSFKPADYATVVKTVTSRFPHAALVRISQGDTLLLASETPLHRTPEEIDRVQKMVDAIPEAVQDLRTWFGSSDVRTLLLTHLILDDQALQDLVDGVDREEPLPVITDLNLRLEFDAPKRLFAGDRRGLVMARVLSTARADWFEKMAREWSCTKAHAEAFHTLSGIFDRSTQSELILGIVDIGLRLDSEHPALLGDKLIMDKKQDMASFQQLVDRLNTVSTKELNRVGVTLFQESRLDQAVPVFQRLLETTPNSVTTRNNLAVALEALGRVDEAEKQFLEALRIDPVSDFVKKSYGAFLEKYARRGRPAEAVAGAPAAEQPASKEAPPAKEAAAGGGNGSGGNPVPAAAPQDAGRPEPSTAPGKGEPVPALPEGATAAPVAPGSGTGPASPPADAALDSTQR